MMESFHPVDALPRSLLRVFLEHAAISPPTDSEDPALEAALGSLLSVGRAAWPQLVIPEDAFARFLARQLPADLISPTALASLLAADLYLVCALGLGLPAAVDAFEADYMSAVERALRRLKIPEPSMLDIMQGLYGYLLERQNASETVHTLRRGYIGRGELRGWLCTCAVHEAGRLQKRSRRDIELDDACETVLPTRDRTPELAALTGELKTLFEASFREAVAALSSRERNLLRYHFLSQLSIDQIGTIYRVHRSTAARWVADARSRLVALTRKRFLAAAPMHENSYAEIIGLVRSQLTLNLAGLLNQITASPLSHS